LIFIICMIVLLGVCFFLVFWFENLIYDFEKRLPPFDCSSELYTNIGIGQALYDHRLSWDKRIGEWHCFCSNNKDKMSVKEFSEITFTDILPEPEDAPYCTGIKCKYCDQWVDLDLKTTIIGLIIPLIMGIGDVLVELFVQATSAFLKPIDDTINLLDSIIGIMWIQFVNLGWVLIFMSLNI
jgi:hypothetical protein